MGLIYSFLIILIANMCEFVKYLSIYAFFVGIILGIHKHIFLEIDFARIEKLFENTHKLSLIDKNIPQPLSWEWLQDGQLRLRQAD